MKKKRKISKISVIIIAVIIVIIAIIINALIPINRKPSSKKKVNEISSPKDFKNIGEAIGYTGSSMISQDGNNIYIKLKYPTYTNESSNQKYYLALISYVAQTMDYKNFNLIDKEQNINISVTCDKDLKLINDYKINGVSNYFGKEDSKIAIQKYIKTPEVSLNIQSDVIKRTQSKNWQYKNINYGTMESQIDERRIYFEEGYDIRVIENDNQVPKVLGIVFNSRYSGNIVNNLSTKSTIDDVKNMLGEPAFKYGDDTLIGYKSKDIYVFFSKNYEGIEVSVYNNEQYDTNEFASIVTKFLSNKEYNTFIDGAFEIWSDYTKYSSFENNGVELDYYNKGVKLEFNSSNPSGVTLYNNFKGKITEDTTIEQVLSNEKELPDNIYFVNEDSVFLCERERISRYYLDENLTLSNELFYVLPIDRNNALTYKFISIDGANPDFEIIDNVKSLMWLDSTHFAYGVTNKGIFLVNALTRNQTDVVRGTSTYDITKYEDGVLYYDNAQASINF